MKIKWGIVVSSLTLLLCVVSAPIHAVTIPITGYDITDARLSGYGGWTHFYTGTITNTGVVDGAPAADYSGGSGTMNDGALPTSEGNSQLFSNISGMGTVITLYFDQTYLLDDITLFADIPGNGIPGNITGLDLAIGAASASYATTAGAGARNEFVLISTPLDSMPTDHLILSNFATTGGRWSEYFSIGEIEVNGEVAGVIPEPATLSLLALGALALRRRRR